MKKIIISTVLLLFIIISMASASSAVIIGDSIARGNLPSRLDMFNQGISYDLSIKNQDSSFGYEFEHNFTKNTKWYNQAIGGTDTSRLLQRFNRDALGENANINDGIPNRTLDERPSLIIIDTGTAALMFGENKEAIKNNLYLIIKETSKKRIPVIVISLCPIVGQSSSDVQEINSWEFHNLTKVSDRIRYFDAYKIINSELISTDGIHLKSSAYVILSQKIYNENLDIFYRVDSS